MVYPTEINVKNQPIYLPILEEKKVTLFIKREDAIHPYISGNKYRKLKYNIQAAKQQKFTKLLTFGGAYSNHILATAVAGKLFGCNTVGVIRGEELAKNLPKVLASNPTLQLAHRYGMQFKFVTRATYKTKTSAVFIHKLKEALGNIYVIPEGGTNDLAVKGCEEILTHEDKKFDYICVAVGTGGTISGLINTAEKHQKIIGFPALKGDFLTEEIKKFVTKKNHWSLQSKYHFGGYGKYDANLIQFINWFKEKTTIPLDPIYTGKLVYGVLDMIATHKFPPHSTLLLIHTGGLQGIQGVNQKLKKKRAIHIK